MNKRLDLENVRIYSKTKQDTIDALDLIGQEVFMSDNENFNEYTTCRLTGVQYSEDDDFPFLGKNEEGIFSYIYCIPAKDVKFKERKVKVLRPYKDISEFCVKTGCIYIGKDLITIRNKNTQKEYGLLYVGYSDGEVHLGGYVLTFADLLKNYEYALNSFEWLPFGVEE